MQVRKEMQRTQYLPFLETQGKTRLLWFSQEGLEEEPRIPSALAPLPSCTLALSPLFSFSLWERSAAAERDTSALTLLPASLFLASSSPGLQNRNCWALKMVCHCLKDSLTWFSVKGTVAVHKEKWSLA